MALVFADRVKETSSTTGTGTLSLDGPVDGFQGFVAGIGDGNETFYVITDNTDWETGRGTVTNATPDTLSRDTVFESSNADAKVNWGSGDKTVRCTLPASSMLLQGKHTIPLLAAAFYSRNTNGAFGPSTTELATNDVSIKTFDFDASTEEGIQVALPMPKSSDETTGITAEFIWTAASGSGAVVWGASMLALGDDDAIDAAFGTEQTVTDTLTAVDDVMISSATSEITPAGSWAENDILILQVVRKAADGSDTLGVDAKLIAVRLKFTVNAADDT